MTFCTKCGAQLGEGIKFCTTCGSPSEAPVTTASPEPPAQQQTFYQTDPASTAQPTFQQPPQNAQSLIVFDAYDEDKATITISGRTISAALIIKILALGLCILFFLPMLSFRVSYDMYTGTESFSLASLLGEFIFFIVILLIPAAIFVMFQFKKSIAFLSGKLFKVSMIVAIVGIIFYIYANTVMNGFAEFGANEARRAMGGIGSVETSFTFWHYLNYAFYAIIGFLSFKFNSILKKR